MANDFEDIREILEFPIPPDVDEKITTGEWIFDTVAITVTMVFLSLWMLVCVFIWFAIGTPIILTLFIIAVFFNFLRRFFVKEEINPSP